MAARGATKVFPKFKEQIGLGGHNLSVDDLKVMLVSDTYDSVVAQDDSSDFTEVTPIGGGYLAGGESLSSITFGESGGTAALDAADVVLSKNAAGFTNAKTAIIYNDDHAGSADAIIAIELTEDAGTTAVSLVDGEVRIEWGANIVNW